MVRPSFVIRLGTLAALVACGILGRTTVAHAHPLHTSFAAIAFDPNAGAVMISLRVFADDFTRASSAYQLRLSSKNDRAAGHSAGVGYAIASLRIADDAGRPLALESCGEKRVGDLMWLCLRARVATRPKSLRVSCRILFDLYKDQINVVQATFGHRKSSTLFTPGDGFKQVR